MASRHLYRPIDPSAENLAEMTLRLEEKLRSREARFGRDDILLVPPLTMLGDLNGAQVRTPGDGYYARALEHVERSTAIAMKAGAPAVLQDRLRVIQAQLERKGSLATQATRFVATVLAAPSTTPHDATRLLREMLDRPIESGAKLGVIDQVAAFLKARGVPASDERSRMVTLRRIRAFRDLGQVTAVSALARAAQIPGDQCQAMDLVPVVDVNAGMFTPADYPDDLIRPEIEGQTSMEFDVTATGTVAARRIIATTPPGLFDAIAESKSAGFRFQPAERGGRKVACRGHVANFIWKLPDGEDDPAPGSLEPGV